MAIGFIRRIQLQRKLNRALAQGKIAKAAVIDAHFRDLVEDETPKSRENKSLSFRKNVSAEDRLAILKEQYRRAHEVDNIERAEELRKEFLVLVPGKESELAAVVSTLYHFRSKVKLLEKQAVVFRAMALDQKNVTEIDRERVYLFSLVQSLKNLKEIVSGKGVTEQAQHHVQKTSKPPVSPMPVPLLTRKSVIMKAVAKQDVNPYSEVEKEIDEKIVYHEKRIKMLDRIKENRAKDERSQVEQKEKEKLERTSYRMSDEVKQLFQNVLHAFPEKPRLSIFSKRKPFIHQSFIQGLIEFRKSLIDGSQEGIEDQDASIMKGMLYFFRRFSKSELVKILHKIEHPEFKNFVRGLDYYADVHYPYKGEDRIKGVSNFTKLGIADVPDSNKSLHELAESTENFLSALRIVLDEHKIEYKHFNEERVNAHEKVLPSNQNFIRGYITQRLAESEANRKNQEGEQEQMISGRGPKSARELTLVL